MSGILQFDDREDDFMSNAEFSPSPITKQSLSDEVVFQIKEMIADGRLQPGQRLPTEKELSAGRLSARL